MRKYQIILTIIFTTLGSFVSGQHAIDSLLNERNKLYEEYQVLNDSVAGSANPNMQILNQKQNEVIATDNNIIQKLLYVINENLDQKEQIRELVSEYNTQKEKLKEYEEIKLPAIIIAGALLILFLLFLILCTSKTIKLKKIRFKIENYESSYEENKSLLENLTKENSELKARGLELEKKIEKLINENNTKIKLLKTDLDNITNENKLLQKRQAELAGSYEKEKETRKLTEDESMTLKEKNFMLEQQLSEHKKILEKETQTRKHIEEELSQLLDQLKGL